MMMRSAAALWIALLAASACSKKSTSQDNAAPASDRPPVIAAPERKRGIDACATYVERLCACAKQKPELAESCELKHAKPEALALALSVTDDPSATRDSILRAQREVRTITARCIEEAAQLPTLGCP